MRPIDILTGEIAIEVTGVVGVSPALWYFRYIASIFVTLHKRPWVGVELSDTIASHKTLTLVVGMTMILDDFLRQCMLQKGIILF